MKKMKQERKVESNVEERINNIERGTGKECEERVRSVKAKGKKVGDGRKGNKYMWKKEREKERNRHGGERIKKSKVGEEEKDEDTNNKKRKEKEKQRK